MRVWKWKKQAADFDAAAHRAGFAYAVRHAAAAHGLRVLAIYESPAQCWQLANLCGAHLVAQIEEWAERGAAVRVHVDGARVWVAFVRVNRGDIALRCFDLAQPPPRGFARDLRRIYRVHGRPAGLGALAAT